MTQYEVLAKISLAMEKELPKEGKIFNVSMDFVNEAKKDVEITFETEHRGHRTMVAEVRAKEGDVLVAEGVLTLLF